MPVLVGVVMDNTPTVLGAADAWSVILGILVPLAVSAVARLTWTAQQKLILQIVIAIVVGLINAAFAGVFGNWSWGGALGILVVVYGFSQAAYALLWRPTGIAKKLEAVGSGKHE